jgi:hypothetical protein
LHDDLVFILGISHSFSMQQKTALACPLQARRFEQAGLWRRSVKNATPAVSLPISREYLTHSKPA